MRLNSLFLPMYLVAATLGHRAHAQDYDVVIINGRVMDPETGFDQVANVGISNGWITAITTDTLNGAETIDATGHVVAPGFIDLEQHSIAPKVCFEPLSTSFCNAANFGFNVRSSHR